MAQLGSLIVSGAARFLNNIFGNLVGTVNGFTIGKSVPADAKFTDTITTASTTGSGNAVTAVTSTNGALTVTKGTTFLTSHQDISGKADKSATVSAVTWDTTNKKLTKTINGSTTDVVTGETILGGLTKTQVTTALGYTPPTSDTNTHRPIQVNGTEVLGNNTTALNLKAGSNVTVTNSSGTVTIAATDTTYTSKAAASGGTDVSLVTTGEKATWNAKTSNVGTITGITMNGSSKGTSGVVDLGTVITAHQDISGKADKSATVSTVAWDSTNKKLTKTINGTTSDVVTGATILGGLTKAQVTTALGYTPPTTDTNTHYASKNVVGSSTATANTTAALTNGNVYLNSVENGAVTSAHKISGSGATTVTTDTSGNIVINSTNTNTHRPIQVNGTEVLGDNTTALNLKAGSNVSVTNSSGTVTIAATDTTYSSATSSANGLMSSTDKAKFDGMGMVSFGTCDTSGNLADKEVTIDNENWQLQVGSIIGVRFENSNTYVSSATNPITLNVNNTGAKNIQCNGEYGAGINTGIYGGAGKVIFYMYDGEHWVWINNGRYREDIFTSGYCTASPSSNIKNINLTNYKLRSGNVFIVTFVNANTYQGSISFAVNGTSSKLVYINGAPSSSSNYNINPGTYIVYYDGTYYYIRTDSRVPINIQGTVNGHSIGKTVPSDAVFTDTTYDAATATPGNVSTTGAVGTSTAYAREDHVHAIALATGDSNGQVKVAGSNVTVKGLQDGAYVNAPRYVNLGSVSTLPGTWTVASITTDMVCSEAILGTPSVQTGDWTVNTDTAGEITVSGSISGTTTVTLVMVPSISVTGVKK